MTQTDDPLKPVLMRIERVACIIERDSVSKANQMRAREIITLVEMAMRQMGDKT